MQVTFLGAAETVTGSSYLLSVGDAKYLVDCGMFQGPHKLEELNRLNFQFDPQEIDAMFLTHAHIDHCGLIPKLVKAGFYAPIICTPATKDLCEIMLPDSAHIQEEEMKWQNRKRLRAGLKSLDPIYSMDDVLNALLYLESASYDQKISVSPSLQATFRDAGHILGSAILELEVKEGRKKRKIVFSGDIGNSQQAIIRDPTLIEQADFVLLETTYADRIHKSRRETVGEFRSTITSCLTQGGNIVIPAFALERTQEIIYELGQLYRQGLVPNIPVYIDSPLAISATEIFRRHPECYDRETWALLRSGENPLDLPNLHYTQTVEESRQINEVSRAIIISASGMCHTGRIQHHLKHNLWREESHIIFVGFQVQNTLGRKIIDGAKKVTVLGDEIAVKAHIHTLGGFSAHADQTGLLAWIDAFSPKPKKIFLTHGELQGMKIFQDILQKERLHSAIPSWFSTVDL